ncbi:MAG: dihydrofolate reductase [Parcubacteria group bacterium Gr01-1014_17]|nr:MAG: dihydrofolate reductase [Parcubacteria group bacterium Gr01-1014_17]
MQAKISIIVAVGKNNRAIGKTGALLWRISDDLRRFKELTTGHPIIMGRKTFESIGKALPNRTNIVITRNPDFKHARRGGVAEGVIVASSLENAIGLARSDLESGKRSDLKDPEIFIIGGGEIYQQALPLADKLYLTLVESDAEGDTFFPDWRNDFTKEVFREERIDPKTGLKYVWVDLERA